MKFKIFTLIAFCALLSMGSLKAQIYLEENFDYPVDSLIKHPVVSSQNLQAVNGWSTQTSSNALNDSWNITSPGLTYNNYYSGSWSNALSFVNNTTIGPSVYKSWKHPVLQDSTIYISFLVNFSSTQIGAITSPDFFFGIKMTANYTDTNWGACIYAAYDNTLPAGQEINMSIKKSSSGVPTYATSNIGVGTTHLMVLKYKLGKLMGQTSATDTPFDDQMSLFIDPLATAAEPGTPTLYNNDATSKDLFRGGSSKPFGGAVSVYLRSPAIAGNTPLYTIDAIRVGLTWNDVIFMRTALASVTANDFKYSIDANKQISVISSNYSSYELVSVSGQRLMKGYLNSDSQKIDASGLASGVYIMKLHGNSDASAKILIQ